MTSIRTYRDSGTRLKVRLPALGVAAVLTMGFGTFVQVNLAPVEPRVQALVNHKRLVLGPSEVAIIPAGTTNEVAFLVSSL